AVTELVRDGLALDAELVHQARGTATQDQVVHPREIKGREDRPDLVMPHVRRPRRSLSAFARKHPILRRGAWRQFAPCFQVMPDAGADGGDARALLALRRIDRAAVHATSDMEAIRHEVLPLQRERLTRS